MSQQAPSVIPSSPPRVTAVTLSDNGIPQTPASTVSAMFNFLEHATVPENTPFLVPKHGITRLIPVTPTARHAARLRGRTLAHLLLLLLLVMVVHV